MSHQKTHRELHDEHLDHQHEAALRLGAIRRLEDHARETLHSRLVNVLVQRPEPHTFHSCPVLPDETCGCDWLDRPGGPSSDFDGCIA